MKCKCHAINSHRLETTHDNNNNLKNVNDSLWGKVHYSSNQVFQQVFFLNHIKCVRFGWRTERSGVGVK